MHAIQMIALGKKLSNAYAALCEPICRQYGLNQTCFDVLMFCANNPAQNTARDICEVRGIKSGIASVAVETLTTGGLLERQPDPQDRRCHRLVPTEKAAPLIADGQQMQAYFAGTLRQGMTADELAALGSLFGKLEANLRALGREVQ